MSLVSHTTATEKFSWYTSLPCILLMIWRTSSVSKSNRVVFLSILSFFGLRSVSDSISSLCIARFSFSPGVRMGGAVHSVIFHSVIFHFVINYWYNNFWEYLGVSGVSVEIVTVSCMNNIFWCGWQDGT